MSAPAAFRAVFSDWRLIKTRACVQVVLEVPIEQADAAYQVLGGMPRPAAEVWCAVARLNEVPAPPSPPTSKEDISGLSSSVVERERSKKSPAQIAGYLCTLGSFQGFLEEKFPQQWLRAINNVRDPGRLVPYSEVAAECVRILCNVHSRADIKPDNTEWLSLMLAYKLWDKEAEVVPA